MKTFLLRNWLQLSAKISRFSSKIHMPFSRKLITGQDYYDFIGKCSEGVVLLSRSNGEISNLGIPGFWGHAAIVNSKNSVIEATSHGVVETDMVSFFMNKDYIVALRPKFASKSQMLDASKVAFEQKGKPYDYDFATSDINAFYCSELVAWAYSTICPETPFRTRYILGRETVIPSDFMNAADKWSLIFASKSTVVNKK